jgi:LysM repeat protein
MAANESLPGEQPAAAVAPSPPAAPVAFRTTPMAPEALMPAAPASVPAPSPQSPATRIYVVKKGDSLWKIAKLEGVSVGDLTRANNLTKTSALKIGQKLQVPQSIKAEKSSPAMASIIPSATGSPAADSATAAPVSDASGTLYTVKSGDSLWKIARQQNVTVAAIKQANNLSSDALKIGQKLWMPAASAPATASAGIATPSHATDWREPGQYMENGQTIHIVDFNESPVTIAKKYGIRTDDLMKANNITDATRVPYGQRLVIPLPQQQTQPAQPAAAPSPALTATPAVSSGGTQPALAAPVVSATRATVQ